MNAEIDQNKKVYVKFWMAVIATTAVTAVSAFFKEVRVSCILVAFEQLWLLAYMYSVYYPQIRRGYHKYFLASGIGGVIGCVVARMIMPKIGVVPINMSAIMIIHGLGTVMVGIELRSLIGLLGVVNNSFTAAQNKKYE